MRLLLFLTILFSFSVHSHQSSVTSSQKKIKWSYTNIPVRVMNTSSSLPSSTSLIDQSIAEWNGVSGFHIQRISSGINQISFSNNFSIYGSAVIGVTEVSYASSGTIKRASIFLNEENYDFTSFPGVSFGNTVYLKDVVTHELGHFVGLGHSEVLNSTMFYQTFPGQAELAADDKAGIRSKYDSGYGKISGYVKGGNDIGILGVNVQAISRKNGEAIATMTAEDGSFEISGLDLDDTYYLHTSSLKNLNALPSYFATVQTEFCPASYVPSFFSQCGKENDGIAQGISLSSSQTEVNIGDVSINCILRVQEDYIQEKNQGAFSTPLEIFNYTTDQRTEKSYVGYFKPSELTTTSFTESDVLTIDLSTLGSPSGKYLKIRLISQPLGHAVEYTMAVKKNSSLIGTYAKSINSAGTYHLDLVGTHALSATASTNTFQIEIAAKKLTTTGAAYAIPDFLNFGTVQNMPYLLVMSLETSSGPIIDSGVVLSDNASCLDAPFSYSVEKSTAKADEDVASSQQPAAPLSCGTIDPPSGPGPGQFMTILTLGFLITILPFRFAKRRKKILS